MSVERRTQPPGLLLPFGNAPLVPARYGHYGSLLAESKDAGCRYGIEVGPEETEEAVGAEEAEETKEAAGARVGPGNRGTQTVGLGVF